MSENKDFLNKYKELVEKCNLGIAAVKPYLEKLSKENDWGTGFYEDITILKGPGASQYNFFKEKYPELFNLWQTRRNPDDTRDVLVYNLKFGGASFILEYQKTFDPKDVWKVAPKWNISNTFMLYGQKEYQLPQLIAEAIKQLCSNQELRDVMFWNHRNEIDYDGNLLTHNVKQPRHSR